VTQTICIIDDDMVSQFASRYCLKQFDDDFDVVTCDSAEDGLELCQDLLKHSKKLPDIIFLDLTMDGMDGWDFIDNLKDLAEGHPQPTIFILSAFTNAKDRAKAKHHTMIAGYFDKPLTKTNLRRVFQAKPSS